jgi:hypothetical protein
MDTAAVGATGAVLEASTGTYWVPETTMPMHGHAVQGGRARGRTMGRDGGEREDACMGAARASLRWGGGGVDEIEKRELFKRQNPKSLGYN